MRVTEKYGEKASIGKTADMEVFTDSADIGTVEIKVIVTHIGNARLVQLHGKEISANDALMAAKSLLNEVSRACKKPIDEVVSDMMAYKTV